jgi:hypothetical protein
MQAVSAEPGPLRYILFPGRHHLLTRFQADYLRSLAAGWEAEVVCGLLRSAGIDCAYRDTAAIDSSLEEFVAAGPARFSCAQAARQEPRAA